MNIIVDQATVQILFDIAINSLDFGSGWLDDEEVEALRECAVTLGVDPITATPDGFKCKYTNEHQWSNWYRPVGLLPARVTNVMGRTFTHPREPDNQVDADEMHRRCVRCKKEEVRPMTAEDIVR